MLRELSGPSLPAYTGRVRADLAAGVSADMRISMAARVIDALDGVPR